MTALSIDGETHVCEPPDVWNSAVPVRPLDWIGADHVMLETDFPHLSSLAHAAGLRREPISALIDRAR